MTSIPVIRVPSRQQNRPTDEGESSRAQKTPAREEQSLGQEKQSDRSSSEQGQSIEVRRVPSRSERLRQPQESERRSEPQPQEREGRAPSRGERQQPQESEARDQGESQGERHDQPQAGRAQSRGERRDDSARGERQEQSQDLQAPRGERPQFNPELQLLEDRSRLQQQGPIAARPTQLLGQEQKDKTNALLLHFVRTKIKDRRPRATTGLIPLKKEGDVMVVSKDELLPSVFKKLSTEGFLSAPVEDFWGRYCGFVTMFDLVKFTNGLFWGQSEEAWSQFFEAENRFAETRVSDILRTPDQWNRDPFHPVYRDFSLFSCLETMALTGAHRLGVVDPATKRIAGIQTQSALISELRQTKHYMGASLLGRRVSDMIPNLNWVIHTIKDSEPAINGFNEMEAKKVHGLAVVDDNGFLVDQISMRDLRGVGDAGQSFWRLYQPIKEFKNYVRLRFPKQAPATHFSARRAPTMPLYVTKDDTFETVLEQMNDGCIHRIFVCSEDERGNPTPTHVISQRDILCQVLQYMTV